VIGLLNFAIDALCVLLIVSALLSWVTPNSRHPVIVFLNKVTEPMLVPIRKVVPPVGGLDLAPLLLLLGLRLLQRLL